MPFKKVRPGEIISSDLMNYILDKLRELEDEINSGDGAGIKINRFDPPNEVAVGQKLTLFGENFAFPPGDNIVDIDGKIVTEFIAPNTSTILTFRVPETISISAEEGEEVTITVTNEEFGSTEATYRLLPPITTPKPTIVSVTAEDGTTTTLNIGEIAIITGTNFAANPLDNTVNFRVSDGSGGLVDYPMVIDVGNSNETTITGTVPDIAEISAGLQRPTILEVKVGSQTATQPGVLVRRVS